MIITRTPNPNAMKFSAGRTLVEGPGRTFHSQHDAADDGIAAPLFGIAGVTSVFMVADFVTVIKAPDADWERLLPEITSALEATLA